MKKIKITYLVCLLPVIILIASFIQKPEMWEAPKSADLRRNPLKGSKTATLKGKILFEKQCIYCHGQKGQGNGVSAADLKPMPTDLSAKMTQAHSDGALYWKIMYGNSPMPAWKEVHKVDHNQCWELINYIRAFSKEKTAVMGVQKSKKMENMKMK